MPAYSLESFNPDIAVGYLAKRIFQTASRGLEPAFVGEDISYLQWSALISVWNRKGGTCRALAHDIGHDKGATTRVVDLLEERGFLMRDRDTGDRRVINLVLTDAGREVAERCLVRVVELWNLWLEDWPADDVTQLISYMQRLRATLEAKVDDDPCD